MNTFKGEIAVGIIFLALLYVVINPWGMFMPSYMIMTVLVALIVLFIAFATFLWKEHSGDEREMYHRLFADRIAYLFGSATLLIIIVHDELTHALDPWIVFVLAVMVIAKIAALIYGKVKL